MSMITPNTRGITQISLEQARQAVPVNVKNSVTQEIVDILNNVSNDPYVAQNVRDNFVTLSSVLTEGRHQLKDYINALHYASYILMGMGKKDAYFKTFPDRYAELMAKNASAKEMSAYASMYGKNKIVVLVLEKALIPVWIQNQDVFQRAIMVQANLMENSQSDLVRTQAANSILTHLARPKEVAAQNQLNVQVNQTNVTNALFEAVEKIASGQQNDIRGGTSVTETMSKSIVDMEED